MWNATLFSDYDLSTVCYDICTEDALKCISACDPTDSECVSVCLRAQVTCTESMSAMTWTILENIIKAVHAAMNVQMVAMAVRIQFVNAQ